MKLAFFYPAAACLQRLALGHAAGSSQSCCVRFPTSLIKVRNQGAVKHHRTEPQCTMPVMRDNCAAFAGERGLIRQAVAKAGAERLGGNGSSNACLGPLRCGDQVEQGKE